MSSTRNVSLGVMNTLRQIVQNLDAQRDQLVDAIERDYPACTSTDPHDHQGDTCPIHEANQTAHRDLVEVFRELAKAREHLVDAHNLLRDDVEPRRPL